MPIRSRTQSVVVEEEEENWDEPARKRLRPSEIECDRTVIPRLLKDDPRPERLVGLPQEAHKGDVSKDKSITIASTAKLAAQTVAPFLAKHIPSQYGTLGRAVGLGEETGELYNDPNTKYCYRHRPDMLCRRQADEVTMDKLQKDLESLSQDDRQGIVQVWSLFSAAPSKHRQLMLQGILSQCCFPQLSYLSTHIEKLIKIDFLAALPDEISYRILCYLDTNSLCKAAQVSRRWRQLADDDEVWHRMCEQHIDRKCTKCGVGLPLLERKRVRTNARQLELGVPVQPLPEEPPAGSSQPTDHGDDTVSQSDQDSHHDNSDVERESSGRLSPTLYRSTPSTHAVTTAVRRSRPWKDVYKDRFRVGKNWKHGRYSTKIFNGHTNGVMALQILDNKWLATGSYDTTIKIWCLDTGVEVRTLTGHTSGIRCLQFDETKLISGSLDGIVKIWNWKRGECLSTHQGHRAGVVSLHFDSEYLVSGSVDNTACVWNFKDRSIFSLRGHTDWVNSVRLDSCSRTIFTASDDCTIRMWDLDTKKCLKIYEGHVGQVQQVLPCPSDFDVGDAESLEEPSSDMDSPAPPPANGLPVNMFGYQVVAPVQERPPQPPTQSLRDFFSSQPGRPEPPRYMLSSALDSTIRLWEVHTGRCIRTFFGHLEGVWALAADKMRIVSGAEDRVVKAWDPRTGKCERTFTGHAGPVTCIDLSESRICSGGEDGEVRVYNFTG